MKKILPWVLALTVAGAFIPFTESVSRYYVAVTWTVREEVPTNHVITYDGIEVPILAGQEVTQTHKLYGGANSYGFIYVRRGWALDPTKLTLDGGDAHMYSIRQFKRSGTLKIFGLGGNPPAMHVEIQMEDSNKSVDATARSPVVRATSSPPPHHL